MHTLTIQIPPQLWTELKQTAQAQRVTYASLVLACLWKQLYPERGEPIMEPFGNGSCVYPEREERHFPPQDESNRDSTGGEK